MIRQNKWYDYALGFSLAGAVGYGVYWIVTTLFTGWFMIIRDFITSLV